MVRIPSKNTAQSHIVKRGNYDVATGRSAYGGGNAVVPPHWRTSDMRGFGLEDLSASVATEKTCPGAAVVPPHPSSYTVSKNGLDRALASLKHIGPEGSDAQGMQATGGDDVTVGGSGTGDNGSGKLPSMAAK